MLKKLHRPKPPALDHYKDHVHSLLHQIDQKLEKIMANEAEIIAKLKSAASKQEKTIAEIGTLQGTVTELRAEIVTLKDLLAVGGEVTPELVAAADRVEVLAGQADDQIPDLQPIPTP
jgi:hypothetical protein